MRLRAVTRVAVWVVVLHTYRYTCRCIIPWLRLLRLNARRSPFAVVTSHAVATFTVVAFGCSFGFVLRPFISFSFGLRCGLFALRLPRLFTLFGYVDARLHHYTLLLRVTVVHCAFVTFTFTILGLRCLLPFVDLISLLLRCRLRCLLVTFRLRFLRVLPFFSMVALYVRAFTFVPFAVLVCRSRLFTFTVGFRMPLRLLRFTVCCRLFSFVYGCARYSRSA